MANVYVFHLGGVNLFEIGLPATSSLGPSAPSPSRYRYLEFFPQDRRLRVACVS
jgi:hypothetical protein